MTPLKFFQQYGRTAVLVIMSTLLVVFLLEPVLMSRSDPGSQGANELIGRAFGDKIYGSDLLRASGDLDIFNTLRLPMPTGEGGEREASLTTYLLLAEVDKLGMTASRERVLEHLRERGIPGEAIDRLSTRLSRSTGSIYDTIGKRLALEDMILLQISAIAQSTTRRQQQYQESLQQAQLTLSTIDSRAWRSQVPAPTEEQLQAFFEAGKNRDTAHTDTQLVFGYRQPVRVRVEYLTIDPNDMLVNARVTERDARRFFEANRARFVAQLPPEQQAAGATLEFAQLPDDVKRAVREEARRVRAIEDAQSAMNRLQQEARRPWDQMAVEGGFRQVPPEGRVDLAALARRAQAELPVQHHVTQLLTMAELDKTPLGAARWRRSNMQMRVVDLASRVKGLYTPSATEHQPVLNVGEPSDILSTFPANMANLRAGPTPVQPFFMQILEVAPAGPPQSLDQVRSQVEYDYRLAKAHELAGAAAREFAEAARASGLAQAAQTGPLRDFLTQAEQQAPTSAPADRPAEQPVSYLAGFTPTEPESAVTRASTIVGNAGNVPAFVADIFAAAPSDTSTAPARAPIVVGQSAANFKWLVAEVSGLKPLYQADFETVFNMFEQQMEPRAAMGIVQSWMSPENVRLRTGFEPAGPAAPDGL